MMFHRPNRFVRQRRRTTEVFLLCAVLCPLTIAFAGKVKEVVVRYDDGTEEVLAAAGGVPNPNPDSGPGPGPAPGPGGEVSAVALLDPADGTTVCAPAYLLLRARVEGTPSKVEFYAGDKLIGTSVARPHLIAWRDVRPGKYALTVRATDAAGGRIASPAVAVTVTPPVPGKTLVATKSGDVGALAQQLTPGDTLLIKPGTYTESVRLVRSGTPERPITVRAEQPGTVVLQAFAAPGPLFVADGAEHVVVSGITFRGGGANNQNNHEAAVRAGTGWRVEDCTVERGHGVGLASAKGRNVVYLRVLAQDNARAGIGGSNLKASMMLDCVSRRNNEKGDSNGGGGKFTRADGLLIENHQSYENTSVGVWLDYSNIDVAVRNCEVHHNKDRYRADGGLKSGAAGIFFEISGLVEKSGKQGALLAEGNYVHDNDREGILAWGSRNVTVRDNTMVNDTIELKDGRDKPFETRDVAVVGNRLKDTSIVADGDTARGHRGENIVIDANTYDSPARGVLIRWGPTGFDSLDEARQKAGFEQNGRLGTVTPPESKTTATPQPAD